MNNVQMTVKIHIHIYQENCIVLLEKKKRRNIYCCFSFDNCRTIEEKERELYI